MVVDERSQQVVREPNGAEVAGKMQVDIFHRHDLRMAAAGRTALHAKHGTQAWLAKTDNGLFCRFFEGVAEPYGGGGFALAGGSGTQGRDQDQLAVGSRFQAVDEVERDLGFV